MQSALLRIENVSKRFGSTIALDDVNLQLYAGEVHALVGENGAGKSTLMKILTGVELPEQGSMFLQGAPYRPQNPLDAQKLGVAIVFQELAIAPHLSVYENIMLGRETSRWGMLQKNEMRARARQVLTELEHPELNLDARIGALSIGSQQLIEIARALSFNARVLILDEPTSSLSAPDVKRLFEAIRRIQTRGVAIVYISHFMEEIMALSNRYTVLRDGVVTRTGLTKDSSQQELIRAMVGYEIDAQLRNYRRETGPCILEVQRLSGQRLPLQSSLQLHRGEVLGLAGLIGAGRTELLRAIYALDPIRKGTVKVGTFSGRATPQMRKQAGVGYLSEDRKGEGLALGMSLLDNLTLGCLQRFERWGWLQERQRRAEALKIFSRLNLKYRDLAQPVLELSGGNQQKIAFGRLLLQDAQVLLLDEPTRGIDVASKALIYRIVTELAEQRKAILLVSSCLTELLGLCDRIAVMRRGVLSEPRPREDWTQHELMLAAT